MAGKEEEGSWERERVFLCFGVEVEERDSGSNVSVGS